VLKLVINVHDFPTLDVERQFASEFAILQRFQQDPQRSPHIIELLYTATGAVPPGLPDWDVEIAFARTQFVAFPFFSESVAQLASRRKASGMAAPFFSEEEVQQIARGLLHAVQYLQSKRVAHRDMKPDNVLVSQCGGYIVPVLTDFGVALDCEADDLVGMQLPFVHRSTPRGGAPVFLPPEIRLANPGRNAVLDYSKSDQFGVGLILWSMLAPANYAGPLPYQEPNTGYVALPAGHCSAATEALIRALTAPFAQRLCVDRMPTWDEATQQLHYDV
jgi:serine/threonine protein kinase